MKRSQTKFLPLLTLIIGLCASALTTQAAVAAMVSTETVVSEQTVSIDRDQLAAALEREDVRAKLQEYGVSPEEAAERVASLTDEEARELAHNIETLPAGGSGTVTILLLVIIILLLL